MTQNTVVSTPSEVSPKNVPKLMLFELSWGGHYPEYLAHLIKYWHQADLQENLLLVVSNQFCQNHPEVISLVRGRVNLTTITASEEQTLVVANSTAKRIVRAFQEFKLAGKYAEKFQADEILFTYFDTRQLPLALGKKLPCPCSGIYFRSRFHYSHLTEEQIDWQEKLARWQEKLLLSATLKNRHLKCIFSLDPYAVKYFPPCDRVKAVALPDPVEIDSNLTIDYEKIKATLGIEPQRKVFLLFGGITKRKGILPLLDALAMLSSNLGEQICLLLVGSVSEQLQQRIQPKLTAITQNNSVQIIKEYRYVTEAETQQYFQLTDVVLALYQRHVGMSGIILRAAAAKKPVLSSDYGLMGEITRRYQLGLTLDSTEPQKVLAGLKQILTKSPQEFINDKSAEQLVHQNSAVNFARTIIQNLDITQNVTK